MAALKKITKKKKADDKKYDDPKMYEGHQYTGMPVGRSHKWHYDKGDWRETKITPDLWEISYAVTKRRAGHAPKGTGVPVGTEYQWYIMAHQNVRKLNGDDYTTELTGLKFKIAHKRAAKGKWNISYSAQRKRLINIFQQMIADLKVKPLKLELTFKEKEIKGEAYPVSATCHEGVFMEFSVSIDDHHLGIIKRRKSGWKMDNAPDQKLITAIGKAIESHEQKGKKKPAR